MTGFFFLNNLKIFFWLVINSQSVRVYIWRFIGSEAALWLQRGCFLELTDFMGLQRSSLQLLQCWSSLLQGDGQAQGPSFCVFREWWWWKRGAQHIGFVLVPLRGGLNKHEPAFPCILLQSSCCLLFVEASPVAGNAKLVLPYPPKSSPSWTKQPLLCWLLHLAVASSSQLKAFLVKASTWKRLPSLLLFFHS